MKRLFRRDQILTIPNLLSLIRLLLIPVIIILYCVKCEYIWAVVVILFSALTDIVDGIIARRFNMITDLGKILDPVADKFTQASLLLCLVTKHREMLLLISVFAASELLKITLGWITLKKHDSVNSAKWYGKANTVILYLVLSLLIVVPEIPENIAKIFIYSLTCFSGLCGILYTRFYLSILLRKKRED